MAGYAAVISLKNTIDHILESSRLSLVPGPSLEIIKLVYSELETLQEILERLDSSHVSKSRKKVNALDARIKEAVWRFEDSLESLLSHQILSQGDERDAFLISLDLQKDVDSFVDSLKDMEEEYIYELHNMPDVEEDELGLSENDYGCIKSEEMVGLRDQQEGLKDWLMQNFKSNYALIGRAGIGKTTFAKKIFEDQEILRWFEHRAWVTVGRKSQFNQVSQAILAQLAEEEEEDEDCIIGSNSNSNLKLKERLEGKKCLIVLDDVWDKQILDCLATCLPKRNGGNIKILITARLRSLGQHHLFCEISPNWMHHLNVEESKELLRRKVFGDKEFPPHLDEVAKKIAENCEGLPLMIVIVADRLSKAGNNELEYWNEVARKRSSVFMDAYEEISKVLFPTYDCLPQRVKTICSYLGAFPQDYEIPLSKLINLLTAERFTNEVKNLTSFLCGSLREISAAKWTTTPFSFYNTCKVYSCWWYLFKKEASNNKFLFVLTSGVVDALEQHMKGQRRLCLHANFVLNFKEVHNSVKSDCASIARSLLCFGPYHPYSMPLDVGFKLLRVLDALKVRFYSFPVEILELVLLQYLALGYNGKLPTSISRLFNLQFLIIHPHMTIKSCGASSYELMPVQVWDMQELKHVEILGSCLPNPTCATSLHKLSTLLGVNARSCTREVLKKLPNVRKLGFQIELTPPQLDNSNPLINCFSHISELENLETLECSVTNPWLIAPITPLPMFTSTLGYLHLSGLGYPWKYMEIIGSLPNLEKLELRCYAFRGPTWETVTKSFPRLEYLIIEDTDLVQWKPRCESFPVLYCIKFKHCYKLKELHWPSVKSGTIELVDCNPLAVTCAKKFTTIEKNKGDGKTHVTLYVRSTWL